MYSTNSQIKFKTSLLKSSLFDYSDRYIHVMETTTVPDTAAAAADNTGKKVIFKNCTPFIDFISEINNTQVDTAKDIDVVMPMYNLIEYSDIYSKTSESLWQYYRDELALDNNNNIIDFLANKNNSISLKFKEKITGQTGNDGTKDVKILVSLKYIDHFWRIFEILIRTGSENYVLVTSTIANQVSSIAN